jgi:aminoglycoside 6'-N-acetyltransferase I
MRGKRLIFSSLKFFAGIGSLKICVYFELRSASTLSFVQLISSLLMAPAIQSSQGICNAANYAILARDYFKNSPPTLAVNPASRKAVPDDIEIVTDLLCELYSMDRNELLAENKQHFSDSRQGFFLSFTENKPIGIAHVSLRSEYVNGTELGGTCGYLEAIYVRPEYRKNRIAANLVRLCEMWAKEHGCREFASDCLLHNTDSYLFHLRLGFAETERCIFFRKDI